VWPSDSTSSVFSRVFTGPAADLRADGFNDIARSLRLPAGETWDVCVNANFIDCKIVNTDWPDLDGLGVSRRISSVRPRPSAGAADSGKPYILFYDLRGFQGGVHRVEGEASTLGPFLGRAQSLRVFGGSWEICERPAFQGQCRLISADVPDLSTIGLANRVGSARFVPLPR